jgi:hypothetical protein
MADKPLAIWRSLNARQRLYLQAVYESDQEQESNRRWDGAHGYWSDTPADVWRWILHATLAFTGDTDLKRRLRDWNALDEGTGSTYATLQRHGLVELQYTAAGTPYETRWTESERGWYVFVKLTKAGRAAVRAAAIAGEVERDSWHLKSWLTKRRP